MAKKELKNIFLSASVPVPERDEKYIDSADIIAIRDAVIALATIVLPHHRIIWGGHPSITPLIYYVMEKLGVDIQEHLILYQSKFFEQFYPADNNKFNNVFMVEAKDNRDESLFEMRKVMLESHKYEAGVFIGGMEGVEEEYKMFDEFHCSSLLLPIASTGAASAILYEELLPYEQKDERLLKDYTYTLLFKELLIEKI